MLPDSDNATDNPCDFSSWFNNSEDADVLLHLSTSAEADRQQQKQQLSLSAAVDEDQQEQQVNVSAAVDEEQQEQQQQQQQQLSVLAFVDGEQQEQQQQQQQQLSVLAEANKQLQQQQQQHARSFHAHAVILRQRSAYFRSSLTNAWQQASKPRSIGDRETAASAPAAVEVRFELVEHVETDKLDAMEKLLRLMYSQKVPVGTPIELLLQMLRLADCYQAVSCMQLLLTHLATAGKHAIPLNLAAQLFSMPAIVQTCLAFKSLCSEVAVSITVMCLSAVIQSDDLRQQFCKLPHAAVLAWAESDRLQVQSENCVVYLLSAWVKAQQQQGGQGVSAAQLDQLAHQVRVLQLGLANQFFVLPNLKWFKCCSSMAHWNTLMAYKGMTSTGKPVYPSQAFGRDCEPEWQWDGPAAWVAGPRPLLPAAPRSLKWDLGPEELQQLYAGSCMLDSAMLRTPHNGFQLGLSVRKREEKGPGQGRQGETLGAYFYVAHQLMSQHGVPWPDTASVAVGRLDFKVSAASGVTAVCRTMVKTRSATQHQSWGFANILRRAAAAPMAAAPSVATLEKLVAPLLVDGKLLVEMTVEGVDEAPRQRHHDSCDDDDDDHQPRAVKCFTVSKQLSSHHCVCFGAHGAVS